jgi:hypothetical protein
MTVQTDTATVSFDNTQAFTEGWGIFEVGPGTEASFIEKYGRWSLDRLAEGNTCGPVVFGEDADQAWGHVVTKALEGSAYHQGAIQFLRQHNPLEIDFMRDDVPAVDQVA